MFLDLVKFEHSIFALPYAYIGALYGAALAPKLQLETFPPQVAPATPYITLAAAPDVGRHPVGHGRDGGRPQLRVRREPRGGPEIDARNPRTAGRAVPAGLIKAWELWLFSAVVLAAFLFAVWQLHPVTRLLWPIVLAVFVAYPYLKRFTWLCHYWLGLCLGLAPVGGWVAVTGNLSSPAPWVLGLAVLFWLAGFDIIYALHGRRVRRARRHPQRARGLRDPARARAVARLPRADGRVARACAAGSWRPGRGTTRASSPPRPRCCYENTIVKADDLSRVDFAFFTMNAVTVVLVFAGALADRLLA